MTRADCRLAGNQQLGKKPGAPPWSQHIALYFTLFPDERTCAIWVAVVHRCRFSGQKIQTIDAWIAFAVRQFGCPLVTTDFESYAAIELTSYRFVGLGRAVISGMPVAAARCREPRDS